MPWDAQLYPVRIARSAYAQGRRPTASRLAATNSTGGSRRSRSYRTERHGAPRRVDIPSPTKTRWKGRRRGGRPPRARGPGRHTEAAWPAAVHRRARPRPRDAVPVPLRRNPDMHRCDVQRTPPGKVTRVTRRRTSTIKLPPWPPAAELSTTTHPGKEKQMREASMPRKQVLTYAEDMTLRENAQPGNPGACRRR